MSAISQKDAETGDLLNFSVLARNKRSSWERADPKNAAIDPISSYGWRVILPGGNVHVVALAKQRDRYVGRCDCKGFQFHEGACAHLCTLRKADFVGAKDIYGDPVKIATTEVKESPPTPDLSVLTRAERNAYVATRIGDVGVRVELAIPTPNFRGNCFEPTPPTYQYV
ncbi:hypothetical protein A4G99_09525 [Haladaptatus sp. R4]|uniref:hypothetical protein n=1 Tax=Haladaptatus sp. R4 TaxID=1679489 RepID=UPI0007B494CE|nr:hypothetical protein [Haladaptatus sp. R4]KZN24593.1 hypothetical protein A4G99_09525 [Haladaptatus sp. R4]